LGLTLPLLVPKVLEKSRAITLLTLGAFMADKKGESLPITVPLVWIRKTN